MHKFHPLELSSVSSVELHEWRPLSCEVGECRKLLPGKAASDLAEHERMNGGLTRGQQWGTEQRPGSSATSWFAPGPE